MSASHIWIIAALLAGLFQAWRTALQQHLRGALTLSGAGLVRYACGLPFACTMARVYLAVTGSGMPVISLSYIGLAAGAGLAQILATALLIHSFSYRGFIVGTAFSKTEALIAAVAAAVFLSERLSPLEWAGVLAGVFGVMLLTLPSDRFGFRALVRNAVQPAALCGIGAAVLFAVTALLVRQATIELDMADAVAAAVVTLAAVMALQAAMHGAYVTWREPQTWRAIWVNRRSSILVGMLATLGSACWFTGFATAPVALVRVVGQVEVLFTMAFARFYLAERVRSREAAALLLIAAGVILALLPGLA